MQTISESLDLSGKTAIVTGGAKGIGYGISYRLAEAGAQILIADTDEAASGLAVDELESKGWKVAATTADVSNEGQVVQMVAQCLQLFGSVDILVNNAGIYPSRPIAQMSEENFDNVMRVNLRSVFLTTKHVAEAMKTAGRGGKIINITSIDALHPSMVGLAHYDASKHGVWGFTKNAALELAPAGIWVNAIAPGGVNTPGVAAARTGQKPPVGADAAKLAEAFLARIPAGRMGEPDDIGKVALFLASGLSSYMTGSQIVVDGGALLA